ncbi:MAG: peptide transporter [Planctomycetota bacterium]
MAYVDKDLEEIRNIMVVGDDFEEGFGWRTVIGALFLGFVMMPASMFAGLVVGGMIINEAARWVTVILFMEVAKRALVKLKKQEVFVLYYMSGLVIATPFSGMLWQQYLVQSDAAMEFGMTGQFPSWIAPSADIIQEAGRTFLTMDWFWPIILVFIGQIVWKIDHFGLGYFLYRLTSDAEKLPFPMAPVGASGALALAESTGDQQTWRWRVFSIGTVLGLLWGMIYFFVPSITNAFLGKSVQLIPLPWIELTSYTSTVLPAVATGIIFDFSAFAVGMVLPFWSVMGGMIGLVLTALLNPTLQTGRLFGITSVSWLKITDTNYLPNWKQTMTTIDTQFFNGIDFYLSLIIGMTVGIATIGIAQVIQGLVKASRVTEQAKAAAKAAGGSAGFDWDAFLHKNKARGDISVWTALGIYLFSTLFYTIACVILAPGFPWFFLIGYAFIYTPLISYATARLEGVAGQALVIPYIKELSFVTASKFFNYEGINIWFAPIPIYDYGRMARSFRQIELTGTKFSSIIKTELMVLPIVLFCGLLFSHLLWKLAPVPSDQYPYAQKVWSLQARNMCLMYTSTTGAAQDSPFYQAIKGWVILGGWAATIVTYLAVFFLGGPVVVVYGIVRGLSMQVPHIIPMEFLGAIASRYVFMKKFGKDWRKFAPVLLAGLMCGQGLVMASSVALTMIAKAVSQMSY